MGMGEGMSDIGGMGEMDGGGAYGWGKGKGGRYEWRLGIWHIFWNEVGRRYRGVGRLNYEYWFNLKY